MVGHGARGLAASSPHLHAETRLGLLLSQQLHALVLISRATRFQLLHQGFDFELALTPHLGELLLQVQGRARMGVAQQPPPGR